MQQMKATLPVVHIYTVHYAWQGGSIFHPWMKSHSVTTQMKATEQYFPMGLFVILYKMVLIFESVDDILKCDHSNENS